jgi:hypothetical protein
MSWLRRARSALGMGFVWAAAWALVGGFVMEGIVDPDGRILDMWPQTLAIPGFISGVLFSIALAWRARHRQFEELSLVRFGGLGAAVGAGLAAAAVAAGLAQHALPLMSRLAVFVLPAAALGGVTASSVLAVARMAGRRDRLSGAAPAGAMLDAPDDDRR